MPRGPSSGPERPRLRAAELTILVGVMGLLGVLSWSAVAQVSGHAVASEAEVRLAILFRSSASYFSQEMVKPDGTPIAPQFPRSHGATPAMGTCCRATDGLCRPGGSGAGAYANAQWDDPTWQALNFAISDPHYLSYRYESSGLRSAARFRASAHGDLDCDGVFSTFERTGMVTSDLNIQGSRGISRRQPTE